jgi:DNA segregation ATPase FtsK/SpoIIIE, S-DNA-T family
VVARAPMFLVFAGASLVTSIGLWAMGSVGAVRDGRRWRATRDRDVARFATAVERQRDARWRFHLATTPGVAEATAAAGALRGDVWSRRREHQDAYRVSLGWGPVEWTVALAGGDPLGTELVSMVAAAGQFDDAPVGADVGPGAALAIGGPGATAVARAVLVQVATWVGPADLAVVVIVDAPGEWDWCRWLPHTAALDGPAVVAADDTEATAAVLAGVAEAADRHVLVVTDRADLLAVRTGPLRRFLAAPGHPAVLAVIGPTDVAPAMCRSILELGSIGVARWWADVAADAHPVPVHAAGVAAPVAAAVARRLAALSDPEDADGGAALPADVGLGDLNALYGTGPIDDAIAVAAAWRSAGPDPAPVAILGAASDGVVEVDLARDGPHALIAGTTGAGKSELLRTFVASLAARGSPDHVSFVLVDYKGGATFDACAELPHTVGLVTDLDDRLAERALVSLEAELRRRERLLRSVGAVDLADWRTIPGRPPLPRLVVVVDEFAALAAELPGFIDALVGVAQRGRSLGVHLVLATQRPGGVVSDDIRANTNLRIALRLHDVADARDVVGDDAPATFPRRVPGRTVLRLGPGEHVVFQAARGSGPARRAADPSLRVVGAGPAVGDDPGADSELAVLVRSIRNAAALCDVRPPHRPWLPPLPVHVDISDVPPGAVGLIDDPAEQRRLPLGWTPSDGNLVIVGAVGSGTTTIMRSVLLAACAGEPPGVLHVSVIDACGDPRLDELAALDHCAGVVRPHERERLSRLLRGLAAELDARRASGPAERPVVVLAIDGLPALRTVLDDPLDHADADTLSRLVAEGPGVGIVHVVTAERPGAVPAAVLAACPVRWVLHLDDPSEAGVVGVPGRRAPGPIPGRLVVAATCCEAQAVDRGPTRAAIARGPGGPAPVGILPSQVDAADLPPGRRSPDGTSELVIGTAFETLAPAILGVPDGEHVLVAGPARAGRSTTLIRLAATWRDANPRGLVRVVAPRPVPWWPPDVVTTLDAALAAVTRQQPALLLVDDAERVADPGDRLASLLADRRPGLLVVAAGRPDALRSLFGHWTAVLRRSRIGILAAACADIDGDLVGELLPRRRPLPSRPGLAWLVDGLGRRLVQVGAAGELVGGGDGAAGAGVDLRAAAQGVLPGHLAARVED